MIAEMDIRDAMYALMQKEWPKKDYRYYMREVHEAYRMPCFFILAEMEDEAPGGALTVRKSYYVRIQYYEEGHSEKRSALVIDRMRRLLLLENKRYFTLHVKDRFLEVKHFSYDYVGTGQDVLEMSFRLEFFDTYAAPDETPKMHDVHVMENLRVKNNKED